MDDWLCGIFEHELELQCRFIVIGAHEVNIALAKDDTLGVWFALQGILISAANASKLLWGSKEEDVLEARRSLRERAGVDETSPLHSRKLRNDFEHFDERLEKWFEESEFKNYFGRSIGPPDVILAMGEVPKDYFGHFDPSTSLVTFWTNSASLNDVVADAQRILRALKQRGTRPETPTP